MMPSGGGSQHAASYRSLHFSISAKNINGVFASDSGNFLMKMRQTIVHYVFTAQTRRAAPFA
jgi:elongation factor P hydroxylase